MSLDAFDDTRLQDVPFACVVHRRGQGAEIELEGELDLAARSTLDDALATAFGHGDIDGLVVDLTQVTFADSTTVAWLVRADRRARALGARLVTVVAPGPVRDILALTGVDSRLVVVADRQMR